MFLREFIERYFFDAERADILWRIYVTRVFPSFFLFKSEECRLQRVVDVHTCILVRFSDCHPLIGIVKPI